MAYSPILSSEIAVGAPISNTLLTKLRDNPEAIATGASGATKILTNALASAAVTQAKLATNSVSNSKIVNLSVTLNKMAGNSVDQARIVAGGVGESEIASNAVHQSEIATSSGEASTNQGGWMKVVLPGGTYGFWVRQRNTNGAVASFEGAALSMRNGVNPLTYSTSYQTLVSITGDVTGTQFVEQYYISASKPYNLGDGDIPLFVFAAVEKGTGKVNSVYCADCAPWHYNGPTDIRGKGTKDLDGGRRYVKKVIAPLEREIKLASEFDGNVWAARADLISKGISEDYLLELMSGEKIEIEVDQKYKNADMHLIPSPLTAREDEVIVMLDPVSDWMLRLYELKEELNISINELLHDGKIKIGNDHLKRCGPPNVMIVSHKV